MASKLPLRFRILHYFSQVKEASTADLMVALQSEYGEEGQFTKGVFNEHLMSMRTGGLIEDKDVSFDEGGGIVQVFALTEFGRSRLKYLPRGWK